MKIINLYPPLTAVFKISLYNCHGFKLAITIYHASLKQQQMNLNSARLVVYPQHAHDIVLLSDIPMTVSQ